MSEPFMSPECAAMFLVDIVSRESMSSLVASPVRTSASLVAESASTANVQGSGASSRGSFASFDRATSSWRTHQGCFLVESDEFSETWPRSGMTRSGIAFRQQPLAPNTNATGSGLLPTLAARDFRSDACSPAFRAKRDAMAIGKTLPWTLGGLLNPTWCEWFMGYPAGWTALDASVIRLFRKLRSGSRVESSKQREK